MTSSFSAPRALALPGAALWTTAFSLLAPPVRGVRRERPAGMTAVAAAAVALAGAALL